MTGRPLLDPKSSEKKKKYLVGHIVFVIPVVYLGHSVFVLSGIMSVLFFSKIIFREGHVLSSQNWGTSEKKWSTSVVRRVGGLILTTIAHPRKNSDFFKRTFQGCSTQGRTLLLQEKYPHIFLCAKVYRSTTSGCRGTP